MRARRSAARHTCCSRCSPPIPCARLPALTTCLQVVAGSGTGSLPAALVEHLAPWAASLPIVIVSRCETGDNWDDTYYRGSRWANSTCAHCFNSVRSARLRSQAAGALLHRPLERSLPFHSTLHLGGAGTSTHRVVLCWSKATSGSTPCRPAPSSSCGWRPSATPDALMHSSLDALPWKVFMGQLRAIAVTW